MRRVKRRIKFTIGQSAFCKACVEAGLPEDEVKVGGVRDSMATHLRKCQNQPQKSVDETEQKTEASGTSMKKRKLTQTRFEVAKKGVPFSKQEFEKFERQALYATLDANLAFQWTDSHEVKKLFEIMKPEVQMPRRRTVAGRRREFFLFKSSPDLFVSDRLFLMEPESGKKQENCLARILIIHPLFLFGILGY